MKDLNAAELGDELKREENKKYILLGIFVAALVGLFVLTRFMPDFSPEERDKIFRVPKSPMDLYNITKVLEKYTQNYPFYVLFAFIYLYILLQAFAIPGPIFLCVLSGPLFGFVPGFFLALSVLSYLSQCSVLGASCCFFLSYTLGRSLVFKYFPDLITRLNNMVNHHRHNLFWYMLFLRLTPLIPNWFVNLGSPLVGMPYRYFFLGSAIGLIPNNFILLQTGMTLKEIETIGLNFKHFMILIALGFFSLLPTLFKKKLEKLDKQSYESVNEREN